MVMAGWIRNPSLRSLIPDAWSARLLARAGDAASGGDAILRVLIAALEKEGFQIVGVDEVMPEILAPAGVYGVVQPDSQALHDIEEGVKAAREVGKS